MMKNLFILGDSLACPRPWVGIGNSDTYASLIQKEFKDKLYVQNMASGDRCSTDYTADSFIKTYVMSSNVKYVVIQLGIVDCAPRLLTTFERAVGYLSRRTKLTNSIFTSYVRWKSKYRMFFTKWFPLTRVNLDDYNKNILKIINSFDEQNNLKHVFLLNIAYPGVELVNKSYGIVDNIKKYNSVLYDIALESNGLIKIIDIFSKTKECSDWITPDDGHHITSEAHVWISSEIISTIELN